MGGMVFFAEGNVVSYTICCIGVGIHLEEMDIVIVRFPPVRIDCCAIDRQAGLGNLVDGGEIDRVLMASPGTVVLEFLGTGNEGRDQKRKGQKIGYIFFHSVLSVKKHRLQSVSGHLPDSASC